MKSLIETLGWVFTFAFLLPFVLGVWLLLAWLFLEFWRAL